MDWDRRRELLARVKDGAEPDGETRKLWVTWRLLDLRARRPEAFAGGYEPIDAGAGVCAYVRGGEVLVAVAVREGASAEVPEGDWREVLPGLAETHGITVAESGRR